MIHAEIKLGSKVVCFQICEFGVCDITKFGIDLTPSKHRGSIADKDTFYFEKAFLFLCRGEQGIIIYEVNASSICKHRNRNLSLTVNIKGLIYLAIFTFQV